MHTRHALILCTPDMHSSGTDPRIVVHGKDSQLRMHLTVSVRVVHPLAQDLIVRGPAGGVSYGNELFATSETYENYAEADSFNNVERVVVTAPAAGQHLVRVTAPRVMTAKQE